MLQNEHVRVFEVSLPAGDATLWHEHLHDGASVRLTDATVEDQPKDGKAETFRMRRGEVAYGATPSTRIHRVRNVGETAFRNVYIELLTPHDVSTDRAVTAAPDPRVVIENDRVRALRRIGGEIAVDRGIRCTARSRCRSSRLHGREIRSCAAVPVLATDRPSTRTTKAAARICARSETGEGTL